MSPHSLALFAVAILAVAPVIPGVNCLNHDRWLNVHKVTREDLQRADYENYPRRDSCEWESPPQNGFYFRPCSSGLCTDQVGLGKKSGTLRFTSCEPNYVLVGGSDRDTCLNGRWSSKGHRCIPCGRSQNSLDESLRIAGGHFSSKGDFPWMAAIYYGTNNIWEQFCGGTLISPNLVLTAAHCLASKGGVDIKAEHLRVGLGKVYRRFYQRENDAIAITVKETVRQDRFVGSDHFFNLDIGLLVLSENVDTGPYIMPACIDWSAAMEPKHGEVGYLAGWGSTEKGTASPVLKWAFQKYIEYYKCLTLMGLHEKKYITMDKFCTEKINGDGIAEHGDSGGAFTMLQHGAHYVYGVLSTKVGQDNKVVRLFTNVLFSYHLDWLRQQWNRQLSNLTDTGILKGTQEGQEGSGGLGDRSLFGQNA